MSIRNHAALADYFAGRAERARTFDDRHRFEQLAATHRAMMRVEDMLDRSPVAANDKKSSLPGPQGRAS
jgi:hypothetical protein